MRFQRLLKTGEIMNILPIVIIVVFLNVCFFYVGYKIGFDTGYDMADKWADHYFKMWQHGEDNK